MISVKSSISQLVRIWKICHSSPRCSIKVAMRKLEKKDKEWSLEVRMKMCSTYRLFSCKSNSFSYERFGLRTLLVTETEAQGKLKMAYCISAPHHFHYFYYYFFITLLGLVTIKLQICKKETNNNRIC